VRIFQAHIKRGHEEAVELNILKLMEQWAIKTQLKTTENI
jgi:hypothetical protein